MLKFVDKTCAECAAHQEQMTNVELSKTAVGIRLNADFGRIPVILHLKRVSSSLRQGQDITMHNDLPKSPQCVILSRSCATKGGYILQCVGLTLEHARAVRKSHYVFSLQHKRPCNWWVHEDC